MLEALTPEEREALDYVAGLRVAEAKDIVRLAGSGRLSGAAQTYLAAVTNLFSEIRKRDSRDAFRAASIAVHLQE